MEDREIIKLFNERSEQGVIELSKKYGRLCRKIALNILQDESDAEECVNDAFLCVWNLIPPEDPDPLRSYVCRVVRNVATDRYDKKTAQKRNSSYDVALHELDECIENGESVEKAIADKELSEIIDNFLAGLDKTSRVMFVRRYWYSETVGAIAKRVNRTPHAVTLKLARIRERLKTHLIEKGVFYNEK